MTKDGRRSWQAQLTASNTPCLLHESCQSTSRSNGVEIAEPSKNVSKIWKAKYNYNQPLQEVLFDDITWGGKPCRECLNQAKFKRYYELLEQDQLANPLLLHGRELWNGGLRLRVAIEKGYDGIDCVVSDDHRVPKKPYC